MSEPTPVTLEVLRAPPRPWLRRLWVRVLLVLLLICAIGAGTWWWPRRTMVTVWWVGGKVESNADCMRTVAILNWFTPAGMQWLPNHFDRLHRVLVCLTADREITWVGLTDAKVGDEWLTTLRHCPQLTTVALHDRQLGPGLDHLRDCAQLDTVSVQSASKGHLAELRRLPQLKVVLLSEPQSGDLGFDSLTALPQLKSLCVDECRSTNEVLAAMPELPQLETLGILDCTGFVDDDLRYLLRFRNLKYITIQNIKGTAPLGDAALKHLSQLECLKTLVLYSPWQSVTQDGLRALRRMKSLKEVKVDGAQCTPEQLKLLRDQLPNCTITVL